MLPEILEILGSQPKYGGEYKVNQIVVQSRYVIRLTYYWIFTILIFKITFQTVFHYIILVLNDYEECWANIQSKHDDNENHNQVHS